MKDGSFVESGEVQQIVDHPATEYTRALLAAVPVLGPWDETPAATPGRRAAHAAGSHAAGGTVSTGGASGGTASTTDPALTQTGASHD
jgi:peptide/nickel transport system ATP-binding protein